MRGWVGSAGGRCERKGPLPIRLMGVPLPGRFESCHAQLMVEVMR